MSIIPRRGARGAAAVLLVLSAAVPLAGCGATADGDAGARRRSQPSDEAMKAITMPDLSFAPGTASARAGQPVTWHNNSHVTHNVKGRGFFSRVIEPGSTYRHTFATAGRYAYVCTFHPGMRGTIVVH